MTQQRTFKRKVRARMDKTGESYTAARRMLLRDAGEPAHVPPHSDEKLVAQTGHDWAHWFGTLDRWGATHRTHTQIARWLREEHGVAGWWSQAVTVAYEQARGMRRPGERSGGFEAGASRTVAVPVEELFAAVTDEAMRARWLPGVRLGLRTQTAPRSARYDFEDGPSRVVFGFEDAGAGRSRVAMTHEKLSGSEEVAHAKALWRERLTALKGLLEG